jgi:hypothetical protein
VNQRDRLAGCPTEAQLGAFLDGAVTDAERRELQAHLVNCRTCRAIVADADALLRTTSAAQSFSMSSIPWAAAAAILLVIGGGALAAWFLTQRASTPTAAALIAAVSAEPTRPVDGLFSGFAYGPGPVHVRGERRTEPSPTVVVAARETIQRASAQSTPATRAAAGVAHVILNELDEGVRDLEGALRDAPGNAAYQNDLAAAYLARARTRDDRDDWTRALAASERAASLAPSMSEARFNRALALEGLHDYARAADEWAAFAAATPSSAARAEAAARERAVRTLGRD